MNIGDKAHESKLYRYLGVDMAINLLRPGAKWSLSNTTITRWDDPRPQPTWDEIQDTMNKIKAFEDSIPTIWLEEDVNHWNQIEKSYEEKY